MRRFIVNLRAATLAVAMLGGITAGTLPAASAAAAGTAAANQHAGCLPVQALTFTRAQDAAALRHWTPARMRAARGFSQAALGKLAQLRSLLSGGRPASATRCGSLPGLTRSVAASGPQPGPAAAAPAGYPTIGKLTFDADGVLSLNCTATVIKGTAAVSREELIVTAAHCIEGTTGGLPYMSTSLAFSPGWHDNQSPYGIWTVKKVFLNSGWMRCPVPLISCSTNPLDDYAVLVLNPRNGRGIGDVTGADGWSVNQPAAIRPVAIAGIPATSSGTLVRIAGAVTVTRSGQHYRQAATPGLTDGSSGGPWLQHFNATTGLGTLLGDTGGYEQGGPAGGSPSYADIWTSSFSAVVRSAVSYEG